MKENIQKIIREWKRGGGGYRLQFFSGMMKG